MMNLQPFSRSGNFHGPHPEANDDVETDESTHQRLLVVEDNVINQEVVLAMLEDFPYVLRIAADGRQALAMREQESFDAILMDCHLPLLDGYEASRIIRADEAHSNAPRIPIIAMTANASEADRIRCLESGMDDYLSKPFDLTQLLNIIQRWLPDIAK